MNNCIAYATNKGREFLEDTQEEWSHKWANKRMYYDITENCRTLSHRQVKKALNFAMTTWDVEIDITFKPAWFKNGPLSPNLKIDFRSAEEDPYFKEKPSVLAYAYFPGQGSVSGKVVFNNEYIWSLNGKPISGKDAKKKGWVNTNTFDDTQIRTHNIIHVLIHELGHSLGLKHDAHGDSKDVMDAYYSGKLELSDWDILRIRLKYPARVFSKWHHYGRLKKWLKKRKSSL
jgi:hypothetical protein